VLNYNLYNGNADSARIRSAQESLSVAKEQRDRSCRDIRQVTSIAWNDVRKLREQIRYLEQHALSTEKARDAYRQQFDIGQRSLLDVLNFGIGFTDDLDLSFNLGAALGFDFTNWAAIDDLQVGHDSSDMALGFTATALGQYQGTIILNGHSVNASDPAGVSLVRTLIVRANVVDDNHTVPLPGTLALVGAALAAGLASRRWRGRSQGRAYDEGRRMNG
jgi:hypothetical protein